MLPKNQWWEVIANYNKSIFPLQWIGLAFLIIITAYLIIGERKKANFIIKLSLALINGFIGIRFFIMNTDFPIMLRSSQGFLFMSIAILFAIDLKQNKLEFEFPKTGWRRVVFIIGSLLMLLYPFVGAIQGKEISYWIIQGTLPCPTTAYALLLIITARKRNAKLLLFLLLIWAIPFAPLIQIPKYKVYEDSIMFTFGLFALVLFIKDMITKKTYSS